MRVFFISAVLALCTLSISAQQPGAAIQEQLARQGARFDSPVFETPFRENLSEDEKIAGLSRLWAEAQFNFPYFDRIADLDWHSVYLEYLPRVRQTASTLEYYRVLQQMCARLKDGHSGIGLPQQLATALSATIPVRLALIEGHVFIDEVLTQSLRDQGIAHGMEIFSIDGIDAKEYARQRMTEISASTEQDLVSRAYTRRLFDGATGTEVRLSLKGVDGKPIERSVKRVSPSEMLNYRRPLFEFRQLEGGVGYVALNSFMDKNVPQLFDAAFGEISKTNALIIDLRNNSGGDGGLGFKILGYLTDKDFSTGKWTTRNYRPAFRAWGLPQTPYGESDEAKPNGAKLYSKPVIVLTSARTYSAAEDFTMTFIGMKRGTVMGEPTGGSTGQPLVFKLPGGGFGYVVTKRDTFPDGKEFVGIGIQPDIIVHPHVEDFLAGRDTVLAAAIEQARKANGQPR